jgi:hypothetical protein
MKLASQAPIAANAAGVPGYLESFDHAYRNRVDDRYVFGFGKSSF